MILVTGFVWLVSSLPSHNIPSLRSLRNANSESKWVAYQAQEDPVLSMPAGDERARALTASLKTVAQADLGPYLKAGFDEFLLQSKAFRLDLARPLAEATHERAHATWSAFNLALILSRADDGLRAAEVLSAQLQRTPEGVEQNELLERLGLALQGAGAERPGLEFLGSALARGSANAGVVLGRNALRDGQLQSARAIFRSLLDEEPPQSWALRGWGISMLPPRGRPSEPQ